MPQATSYVSIIKADVSAGLRDPVIAEKVYLTFVPAAFASDPQLSYRIRKTAADRLNLPITRVHMCGSAMLGTSPQKSTAYDPGVSDIDLAVVDQRWFTKMLEAAQDATRGYTDLTKFPVSAHKSPEMFANYVVTKGMIRPDLMPNCALKFEWMRLFDDISRQFQAQTGKISGAIYLSEAFFVSKQCSAIRKVKAMP